MQWRPGQRHWSHRHSCCCSFLVSCSGPAGQQITPGDPGRRVLPGLGRVWTGCTASSCAERLWLPLGIMRVWAREGAYVSPSSRSPVFIAPAQGLCLCSPRSRLELGSEPRTKPQPPPRPEAGPCSALQLLSESQLATRHLQLFPGQALPALRSMGRAGGDLRG